MKFCALLIYLSRLVCALISRSETKVKGFRTNMVITFVVYKALVCSFRATQMFDEKMKTYSTGKYVQ